MHIWWTKVLAYLYDELFENLWLSKIKSSIENEMESNTNTQKKQKKRDADEWKSLRLFHFCSSNNDILNSEFVFVRFGLSEE